jgi:hypothetical protein
MGPYDDNPRSFVVHVGFGGCAGSDENAETSAAQTGSSCPTFQQKSFQPTAILHTISLLILFIISQWVHTMVIQRSFGVHFGFGVLPGWMTMPRPQLNQLFSKNPPNQQP